LKTSYAPYRTPFAINGGISDSEYQSDSGESEHKLEARAIDLDIQILERVQSVVSLSSTKSPSKLMINRQYGLAKPERTKLIASQIRSFTAQDQMNRTSFAQAPSIEPLTVVSEEIGSENTPQPDEWKPSKLQMEQGSQIVQQLHYAEFGRQMGGEIFCEIFKQEPMLVYQRSILE